MIHFVKTGIHWMALVLLSLSVAAQDNLLKLDFADIDKKALSMPESAASDPASMAAYFMEQLSSDAERTRAAFVWIATHIDYETSRLGRQYHYKKEKELVDRVLRKRKGLCAEYAALFKALCSAMDIPVETVVGYTRTLGKLDTVPHAWNAVLLDSTWYLVDVTWGAGHMSGRRFIQKLDNEWFLVDPEVFIQSHMPFLPMWQLLLAPVQYRDFAKGKTISQIKAPPFHFSDSIHHFRSLDGPAQTRKTHEVISPHVQENTHIRGYVRELESELTYYKNIINQDRFNEAVDEYNSGVEKLNEFLIARNQKAVNANNKASYQQLLEQAYRHFKAADSFLSQMDDPEKNIRALMEKTSKSNQKALEDTASQLKWLNNQD
jgi:hypothetical protein